MISARVVARAAMVAAMVACSFLSVPAFGTRIETVSTADDYYDLYLDGNLKVTIPESQGYYGWPSAETWTGIVEAGAHVLAVEGYNNLTQVAPYNPAGFLAQIVARNGTFLGETDPTLIVTDASWLIYGVLDAAPPNQGSIAWTDPGFVADAAHGWTPAYVITNGPWGNTAASAGMSSSAEWIWNANWYPPPSGPGDTPVYFRRTFTVVASGEPDEPDQSAVPEPVTMAGLLVGVGALGGYIRGRRVA